MKISVQETIYKDYNVEFDGLTLLSEEEYLAIEIPISNMCWWWLRSSGHYSDIVAYVGYEGNPSLSYYVNYSCGSVRPALIIKSTL